MRLKRFVVLAGSFAVIALACESFETAPSSAADAGMGDAAASDGSGDGNGAGAGGIEVFADGFETSATCGSWTTDNDGGAEPVDGGRTGARACLICASAKGVSLRNGIPTMREGTYRFAAFVRSTSSSGAPNARVTIQTNTTAGKASSASDTRALTTEWSKLEAASTTDGGTVYAYVYIVPDPGCVLVDDVKLTVE